MPTMVHFDGTRIRINPFIPLNIYFKVLNLTYMLIVLNHIIGCADILNKTIVYTDDIIT